MFYIFIFLLLLLLCLVLSRVHGTLTLNKVAGNFHITGGKSIHFASGHIHISSLFDEKPLNFSHRINRFSFGEQTAGIVHPLEGDERIITDSTTMAQYFIEVVPTDIYTFMSHINTFQYSVKENVRPISMRCHSLLISWKVDWLDFVFFFLTLHHRSQQRFTRRTRSILQVRHVSIESDCQTGSGEFRTICDTNQFDCSWHYRYIRLFKFRNSLIDWFCRKQRLCIESK